MYVHPSVGGEKAVREIANTVSKVIKLLEELTPVPVTALLESAESATPSLENMTALKAASGTLCLNFSPANLREPRASFVLE